MTTGRISIVSAPEASSLIARERAAFRGLYPQAEIELGTGSSREAVAALFAGRSDLAVITRELQAEEREAAVRGGLELEGYRFARDAIVVIVHPSNPMENLAVDGLRRIYRGEVADWSEVGGGSGPIEPVIQPPASDITEFFAQGVMGGEPVRARVRYEDRDSAVVARVASSPRAIGYVSLGTVSAGTKELRLASLTGLPYWKPDLEAVYKGDYPLTRYFNLYVRSAGRRLAHGFITFVTSFDGQKLVHETGLVPTSIPVRFVRRSPLLGAH